MPATDGDESVKADDSSAEETRVLSQILAAQNMLCVFFSERRLAEFVKETLRHLPGVRMSGACLRSLTGLEADFSREECRDCAGFGPVPDDVVKYPCKLEKQKDFAIFPLNTSVRGYGYLLAVTDGGEPFARYKPFVVNFANSVAVALENRLQQKRLTDHALELERINEQLKKEIAARELAEEGLRKSQMDLARAQEIAHLGSWVWDAREGKLLWSDEVYRIFGLRSRGFDVSYETFLERVHPGDRDRVRQAGRDLLLGKDGYDLEHRIVLPDGSERVVHQRAMTFYDEKGKPAKVVGTVHDITERRRNEEALRKSQEQLMHSEKLSALGKLISSIVHEFSSPVHGVRGVLEQVYEEASVSEGIRSLTKLGIKECNRMSEMIQKLRGFYRPSAGIAVLLDLNALVDDMIFLNQKKFQSRKIQTVKNYDPNLPRVGGVEDQLKQVVLNLLQNAEEAVPDGGGKIVVTTEATDTAVRLIVQDTGTGIPPDALPFIFDPFFTTKPGAKGTGLGLPVSYGIVKNHRGDIEVKSRFGEGTAFIVTLPR